MKRFESMTGYQGLWRQDNGEYLNAGSYSPSGELDYGSLITPLVFNLGCSFIAGLAVSVHNSKCKEQ